MKAMQLTNFEFPNLLVLEMFGIKKCIQISVSHKNFINLHPFDLLCGCHKSP
jgi:hypothetical protein